MLVDKTEDGRVHWRKEKFGIAVNIDSAKFSIWGGNDENSEEPFVAFGLHDDPGNTIDSWYVEENEGSDYSLMHRLYQGAKRHASGVPEKLKLLKEKIAASKEIGKPGE